MKIGLLFGFLVMFHAFHEMVFQKIVRQRGVFVGLHEVMFQKLIGRGTGDRDLLNFRVHGWVKG
jgi:hypothetical protein